jgi:hypothetical protein
VGKVFKTQLETSKRANNQNRNDDLLTREEVLVAKKSTLQLWRWTNKDITVYKFANDVT